MSKPFPSEDESRFLDEMASLMTPWGWPRHVGRIYAYLLLCDEPVSLDQLSADLGIAKSNVSVAARTLEQFGNARRHSEPGSKRIRYSAPGNHVGPFASKTELLGTLVRLLEEQSDGKSAAVAERLGAMSSFYRKMSEAMQSVLDGVGKTG